MSDLSPHWTEHWAGAYVRERVFTVSQGPALTTGITHWVSQQILPGPGPRTARFPGLWLVPDLTTLGPHWLMSAHPVLTNNMSYVTLTTETDVMTQNLMPLSVSLGLMTLESHKVTDLFWDELLQNDFVTLDHRMDWCRLDWVLQWDRSGNQWHTQGGGYS